MLAITTFEKTKVIMLTVLILFEPVAQSQTHFPLDHFFNKISVVDQPGMATFILKDGKIIHEKGYGVTNIENFDPITSESIFQLASTSKQFTAFAIALLENQKKLKFSDKIRSILKDLPKYLEKITIANLLYHTSGLPDYYSESDLCFTEDAFTNSDVMRFLKKKKKLHFSPGEQFEYSNTGYVLLAEIIKKVSGLPYHVFLSTQIFKPLKMDRTFTAESLEQVKALVTKSYYTEDSKNKAYLRTSCDQFVGDGGIYSNVSDLKKWINNFDKGVLLPKTSITNLIYKSGRLNNGTPTNYGFGWFIDKDDLNNPVIHHGGGWLGYHHSLNYFPNSNVWILVLSNHLDYGPPARTAIVDKILELM